MNTVRGSDLPTGAGTQNFYLHAEKNYNKTVCHRSFDKEYSLFATAISPLQFQFHHGKINFATAISISSRQNQFRHGKINFITVKSISQYGKISFSTAKSVSSTTKLIFGLTCSRDISSQSAVGVNPTWRSSSWFYDSTCIAQTVEIVYFQQHISACSAWTR